MEMTPEHKIHACGLERVATLLREEVKGVGAAHDAHVGVVRRLLYGVVNLAHAVVKVRGVFVAPLPYFHAVGIKQVVQAPHGFVFTLCGCKILKNDRLHDMPYAG